MIDVTLQPGPIDVAAALDALEKLGGGAVASLGGLVRGEGGLVELLLEHHRGMTRASMQEIAHEARARWSLLGIIVIHRHGILAPGERIVFVGTAAPHRAAALAACAFAIDRLKTDAPFWKRERFADGAARWVEPRALDEAAASRWRKNGDAG